MGCNLHQLSCGDVDVLAAPRRVAEAEAEAEAAPLASLSPPPA